MAAGGRENSRRQHYDFPCCHAPHGTQTSGELSFVHNLDGYRLIRQPMFRTVDFADLPGTQQLTHAVDVVYADGWMFQGVRDITVLGNQLDQRCQTVALRFDAPAELHRVHPGLLVVLQRHRDTHSNCGQAPVLGGGNRDTCAPGC